jgi:hypothetical protein
MLILTVRNWFGRVSPLTASTVGRTASDPRTGHASPEDAPAWPPARLAVTDALWGEGFLFPGGETETMRLVKSLGLPLASTLLLLGTGAGGPACALAGKLGLTVAGFEADAGLVDTAAELINRRKLFRQARVEFWNPAEPELGKHAFHHGLAIEPLCGHRPEPVLAAVSQALKPSGQLTLVELVADTLLDPGDPEVADWARLERRHPDTLPTEVSISRVLGRLGFEFRSTEDITQRHMQQAIIGWRRLVRGMEEDGVSAWSSEVLVREAELWTSRLRLFRDGRLRLVRWHVARRGLG